MDSILEALRGSASSWQESKLFIEHLVAICNDTLHMLIGFAIWLALVAISRRPIDSWRPLLGTAALAALNEAVDLWFDIWPNFSTQLGEGARDIFTTMSVPVILFAAARLRPAMFALRKGS